MSKETSDESQFMDYAHCDLLNDDLLWECHVYDLPLWMYASVISLSCCIFCAAYYQMRHNTTGREFDFRDHHTRTSRFGPEIAARKMGKQSVFNDH